VVSDSVRNCDSGAQYYARWKADMPNGTDSCELAGRYRNVSSEFQRAIWRRTSTDCIDADYANSPYESFWMPTGTSESEQPRPNIGLHRPTRSTAELLRYEHAWMVLSKRPVLSDAASGTEHIGQDGSRGWHVGWARHGPVGLLL
jgi:hypothetical protein